MTDQNGKEKFRKEEFKVSGGEIIDKVKALIQEGNSRRIIIKNEEGKVMLEIPLTLGLVGVALAPILAAVGAMAALLTRMTLVVEKEVTVEKEEPPQETTEPTKEEENK